MNLSADLKKLKWLHTRHTRYVLCLIRLIMHTPEDARRAVEGSR